jgi:YD repeat-containing protein
VKLIVGMPDVGNLRNPVSLVRFIACAARSLITPTRRATVSTSIMMAKGLLTRIIDSDGRKTVIQRDKHGKRVGILVTDKRGIRYEYSVI